MSCGRQRLEASGAQPTNTHELVGQLKRPLPSNTGYLRTRAHHHSQHRTCSPLGRSHPSCAYLCCIRLIAYRLRASRQPLQCNARRLDAKGPCLPNCQAITARASSSEHELSTSRTVEPHESLVRMTIPATRSRGAAGFAANEH